MMANNPDIQLLNSVLVPKAEWERMRQSHDALLAAAKAALVALTVMASESVLDSPGHARERVASKRLLRVAIKLAEEA